MSTSVDSDVPVACTHDIWQIVLSLLSSRDASRAAATCKHWATVVKGLPTWLEVYVRPSDGCTLQNVVQLLAQRQLSASSAPVLTLTIGSRQDLLRRCGYIGGTCFVTAPLKRMFREKFREMLLQASPGRHDYMQATSTRCEGAPAPEHVRA